MEIPSSAVSSMSFPGPGREWELLGDDGFEVKALLKLEFDAVILRGHPPKDTRS